MTEEQAGTFVQKYVHSKSSLVIAECGYRLCYLQHHGTDPNTLNLFLGICGGVTGGTPGTRVNLMQPLIRQTVDKSDDKVTVSLQVQGSPDADLPYKIVAPTNAKFTRVEVPQKVFANKINTLIYRLTLSEHVFRRQPTYVPYSLVVGDSPNQRFLSGTVQIVRASDPACTEWLNDSCVRCSFTVPLYHVRGGSTPIFLRCADMPTAGNVRALFEGFIVTDGLRDDGYWNIGAELAISMENATASSTGEQRYVNQLTPIRGFTQAPAAASGIVEAQLYVRFCQTGSTPDTCTSWVSAHREGPITVTIDYLDKASLVGKRRKSTTAMETIETTDQYEKGRKLPDESMEEVAP